MTDVPAAAIAPYPLGKAKVEAQKAADELFLEAASKVVCNIVTVVVCGPTLLAILFINECPSFCIFLWILVCKVNLPKDDSVEPWEVCIRRGSFHPRPTA